ncbi:hypothetical protein XELAEV_18047660mg [Xenopus laevis]|uniref:Uncharacterized protein n=1 Tax=Xenopus laevis TaxID=8355 RepID=A0A974BVY5_XENLA|nr:hypothetical protein XELAEV_18047660mg [Xenopus laevis]
MFVIGQFTCICNYFWNHCSRELKWSETNSCLPWVHVTLSCHCHRHFPIPNQRSGNSNMNDIALIGKILFAQS